MKGSYRGRGLMGPLQEHIYKCGGGGDGGAIVTPAYLKMRVLFQGIPIGSHRKKKLRKSMFLVFVDIKKHRLKFGTILNFPFLCEFMRGDIAIVIRSLI